MIVKKHIAKEGVLLAVCDSDILGKKFETDKLQLDLTSDFYQGEETTEEELRKLIDTAYILNIVGEKSIKFAVDNDLISEDDVLRIQDVPHAQVVIARS